MRKKAIIIGGIAAGILLIGGIAAASKGGSSAATAAPAAPVTVTVTAPPPAPVTVTAPAPAPVTLPAPPAVTVTVTAEPAAPAPEAPAANDEASSPKDDGTYIVGSEIAPGNWKCSEQKSGGLMWWETKDSAGEVNDLGTDGLAHVGGGDFSVWLDDCAVSWTKVS